MPLPVEDYAYDARGNRTSRTSRATGDVETYTYDSQNRLIGYTDGTTVANYNYDALDRRIAKTGDGVTTAYVYDSSDLSKSVVDDIALEFGPDGLTRRWLHSASTDEPLGFEAYTGNDTPGAGTIYEMYADRMGSITSVIDTTTGAVAAAYTYDSFGTRTQHAGSLFQFYGYTGREEDPESGLYYYRARYYDPASGAFVGSDPIGFGGGSANLYAYVANMPYSWVDPSGQSMALTEYAPLKTTTKSTAVGAFGKVGSGLYTLTRALTFVLNNIDVDIENRKNEGGAIAPEEEEIPEEVPDTIPLGVIDHDDGTTEIIWSNGPPGPPPSSGQEQPERPHPVKGIPWWELLVDLITGGYKV